MKNRLFFASALSIIGVLIIIWFIISLIPTDLNPKFAVSISKASKIGDFVGGFVGALFTLSGILLVYETLNLQRVEFSESQKIFIRQQFESTFFQMLNTHNNIVNAIDIRSENRNSKGEIVDSIIIFTSRDCFRHFYKQFKNEFRNPPKFDKDYVLSKYNVFYDKWEADLGHYFRHLYQILKYIDLYGPKEFKDKKIYTNILRATMSSNELLLLFYNALSKNGNEKFKPLLENYSFFNNIPLDKVIADEHLKFYDPKAFA